VAVELIGFGATFAITQTIAAVGFPVIIFALIPVRALVMPHFFSSHELGILDAPTASPFTMESVGGTYGAAEDDDDGTGDDSNGCGSAGCGGGSGISASASSGALATDAGKSQERLAEEGRMGLLLDEKTNVNGIGHGNGNGNGKALLNHRNPGNGTARP
jgi:boron transporter